MISVSKGHVVVCVCVGAWKRIQVCVIKRTTVATTIQLAWRQPAYNLKSRRQSCRGKTRGRNSSFLKVSLYSDRGGGWWRRGQERGCTEISTSSLVVEQWMTGVGWLWMTCWMRCEIEFCFEDQPRTRRMNSFCWTLRVDHGDHEASRIITQSMTTICWTSETHLLWWGARKTKGRRLPNKQL